jgi:hypothetical protein
VAGAREADRPGAAHQSHSNQGDLAHLNGLRRGEAHSMRLQFARRVNAEAAARLSSRCVSRGLRQRFDYTLAQLPFNRA